MKRSILATASLSSLMLALSGCPGEPPVASDGGPVAEDSGPVTVTCPTRDIPSPEQQEGPCCYRRSQADRLDHPELRLRFIAIDEPAASPLASRTVESVLNLALGKETFNWLFQITGAGEDGAIQITTGYGSRNASGSYTLGSATYPTVTLDGTITGDRLATESVPGPLDIPIFDDTGTTLQMVLRLRSLKLDEANLSAERSCVGARRGNAFTTDATLEAFVTVADARAGTIDVDPIHSTLCSVIAGELSTPSGGTPLCDQPQSAWTAKPDSLCDESGCTPNPAGATSVCDPDTTCNAWHLVAQFAAVGIEIE